jgi:hypothetical protein
MKLSLVPVLRVFLEAGLREEDLESSKHILEAPLL